MDTERQHPSTTRDPAIRVPQWLALAWPSSAVSSDPLAETLTDGRYAPIPLIGWKLTPWIERRLLAYRHPVELAFRSDARLAVIVPVRDREHQIRTLIPRLRAKLDEQRLAYRILIVEQSPGNLFNKGALINAGFRIVSGDCDYVCLHDVDAIPIVADYRCPSEPLRLVTKLVGSRHGPRRDARYFGGAITLRREHFIAANGFSNEYWGWGKEDDDFLFRLWFSGRICFADQEGTFEDLPNPSDQQVRRARGRKPATLRANRKRRSRLMRGLHDFRRDGLSSHAYAVSDIRSEDGCERVIVTI